jgi:hypothetical protein
MPLATPLDGVSRSAFERVREQARIQGAAAAKAGPYTSCSSRSHPNRALLRGRVLVDLHTVVRQALRASVRTNGRPT